MAIQVRVICWLTATLTLSIGLAAKAQHFPVNKSEVARVLSKVAKNNRFPDRLLLSTEDGKKVTGRVNYSFDAQLHKKMADVYLRYQPDYACFVAIDVETGAILNITSFIKSAETFDNLVLRAVYPAASVFKLVTAAAGFEEGKLSPDTVVPYNGKGTTLYKKQVLRHKDSKWTRRPSLRESFAKSINPVFGRIGVFDIGAKALRQTAEKLGFGRTLVSDFQLPPSRLGLSLQTDWEVAEAASGFTRDITLSPIHAAQMAAIVANDGLDVTPYMVENIVDNNGRVLYQQQVQPPRRVLSTSTAVQLKLLMRETTRIGSARESFADKHRYKIYRNMQIGGKTGSLTGLSPRGRHDWFVGYAEKNGKQIAYASLIINKEKWYVRSAYVARQFIYHFFSAIEAQAQDTSE